MTMENAFGVQKKWEKAKRDEESAGRNKLTLQSSMKASEKKNPLDEQGKYWSLHKK